MQDPGLLLDPSRRTGVVSDTTHSERPVRTESAPTHRPESRPNMSKTPQVFISHASEDHDFVELELVPAFRAAAVKSWYSAAKIPSAAASTGRERLRNAP